ncbi:MAG: DUF1848 domain-containing protein [Bacteroidales bacterium]|nr:DUF1848 domain-containing protein [Bacteroidales bacterium]
MAQWKKDKIRRENGEEVEAQFPVIVSASRSTDIPAFYADWFFDRMEKGYSAWTNPFNNKQSYVAYRDTRFIVFWSKNPKPLLKYLPYLRERNIGCYIQYTLNDYEAERLEQGVPSVENRIDTFKQLVDELGKGSVVWRFDPLILTDKITPDNLLEKIERIGDSLLGYTEKLVFSFADIASYRKVQANLKKNNINYQEWTTEAMDAFAGRLEQLNKKWGYTLATCGENIDLDKYSIQHNHCVDDTLMIRKAYKDKKLMDFLGVEIKTIENTLFGTPSIPSNAIMINADTYAIKKKDNRDKGQRTACGCMVSKDIGEYNTCVHLCEYCYANASKQIAQANYTAHMQNKSSETITGKK